MKVICVLIIKEWALLFQASIFPGIKITISCVRDSYATTEDTGNINDP